MRNFKTVCPVIVCALLTFMLIAPSAEAFQYWTNKDGSATYFDWANGGSDNGYFGSPILVAGNTFCFFPSNFRAETSNGTQTTTDRFEVELTAHTNYSFTGIKVTEYGTYGMLAGGQLASWGNMTLTDLNDAGVFSTDSLATTPSFPITSGSGSWSATAEVNNINWTRIKFELYDNLLAYSVGGSTNFIQKDVVGSAVAVEFVIPEPSMMTGLGLGLLMLIRRRKA